MAEAEGEMGANVTVNGETDTVAVNAAATVAVNKDTNEITVGVAEAAVTVGASAAAEAVNVNAKANVTVNGIAKTVVVDSSATDTTVSGTGSVTKVEAGANTTVSTATVTEVEITEDSVTTTINSNVSNVNVASGKTGAIISVAEGKTVSNVATGDSISVTGGGTIEKVDVSTSSGSNNVTITAPSGSSVKVDTIVNTGDGSVKVDSANANQDAKLPTEVKTIDNIEIAEQPTKTYYKKGETFDSTGLKLKAYYDSGKKDFTTVVAKGNAAVTFKDADTSKAADTVTVTVNYAGKDATFDIHVLDTDGLDTALKTAEGLTGTYKTSTDGKDVEIGKKWAAADEVEAFEKALAAAKALTLGGTGLQTNTEATTAATTLQNATDAFKKALQDGTKMTATIAQTVFTEAKRYLLEEDAEVKDHMNGYTFGDNGPFILGLTESTTVQYEGKSFDVKVAWESSNTNVISIDADGRVSVTRPATTTQVQVTAKLTIDGYTGYSDTLKLDKTTVEAAKPAFALGTFSTPVYSADYATADGKVTKGAITFTITDCAGYTNDTKFEMVKQGSSSSDDGIEGEFAFANGSTTNGTLKFTLDGKDVGTYDLEYKENTTTNWQDTNIDVALQTTEQNPTENTFSATITNTPAVSDTKTVEVKFTFENYTDVVTFGLLSAKEGAGSGTAAEATFTRTDTESNTGSVTFDVSKVPAGDYTIAYKKNGEWIKTDNKITIVAGSEEGEDNTSTASITNAEATPQSFEAGEAPTITFTLQDNTKGTTITLYMTQTKGTPNSDAETMNVDVKAEETTVTVADIKTKNDGDAAFPTDGTWYVCYKVQGGSWCETPIALTVTKARSVTLALAGESKSDITGKVGEALSQDIKISLINDTFKSGFSKGESIADWFQGNKLPENWTATVKEETTSGASDLTVTIACAMENLTAGTGTLELLIPGTSLTSDKELKAGSLNYTIEGSGESESSDN